MIRKPNFKSSWTRTVFAGMALWLGLALRTSATFADPGDVLQGPTTRGPIITPSLRQPTAGIPTSRPQGDVIPIPRVPQEGRPPKIPQHHVPSIDASSVWEPVARIRAVLQGWLEQNWR